MPGVPLLLFLEISAHLGVLKAQKLYTIRLSLLVKSFLGALGFLAFCAWPTLLKIIFSSSFHLLANDKISFFFVAELNSIVY
jgi:hypothetical protein